MRNIFEAFKKAISRTSPEEEILRKMPFDPITNNQDDTSLIDDQDSHERNLGYDANSSSELLGGYKVTIPDTQEPPLENRVESPENTLISSHATRELKNNENSVPNDELQDPKNWGI